MKASPLFFFEFSWKTLEHFLGKKTAIIPKMQIKANIDPVNGFRHLKYVGIWGGKSEMNTIRNKLKKDTKIMNEI